MNLIKKLFDTLDSLTTLKKTYMGKVYEDTELNISAKEIGGSVELINADSTLSPAPDGQYKMSDGFTFEIKDGFITAIEGQEPVQASTDANPSDIPASGTTSGDTQEVIAADTPTDAPVAQEAPTQDEAVAQLQDRVSAIESKINEIVDLVNGVKMSIETDSSAIQQFNKTVEDLKNGIEVLANTPAQPSKVNTRPAVKEDNHNRMVQLSEILKGIK